MRPRVTTSAAAGLLALEAVVVGVVVATTPPLLLPVTVDLGGGVSLAAVNLGVAAVVLLAFAALCQAGVALSTSPVIRRVEWSQVSAVSVFLVAQLNGIQDVATLVALYALAAAATLFLVLHERDGAGRWPFALGAAVGIVPWGVIAFYQIGAITVGDGAHPLVRVVTIGMLVVAIAYWIAAFDRRLDGRASTLLVAVGVSAFAWLVVGLLVAAVQIR
jgi:Heliorhodopsin